MMELPLSRQAIRKLLASPIQRRVTAGAGWSLLGAVAAQGSNVAAAIIVARSLGQVGLGEFGMITSTVITLGVLAELGLASTATKYLAELRTSNPDRAGRVLGLCTAAAAFIGSVVALGLFIATPELASTLLKAPHLVLELRLSCVLLFLNGMIATQLGALYGLERFRTAALVNVFRGLVSLPLLAIGLWWAGILGAIAAMTLVAFLTWVLTQAAVLKECANEGIHISWRDARTEADTFWQFSLPAFIASALVGPATWLGNILLVNQVNGYAELGAFNAANQWRNASLLLPTVLGQTLLPILASLLGKGDRASTRRLVLYSMAASLLVAVPVATALILGSNFIMGLYGPGFATYSLVLSFVVTTFVLQALQMPVGQVIAASGRMWLGAGLNLGWSLAFIACAWLLVRRGMGAVGLALSYVLSYLIHSAWTGWFGARLVRGSATEPLQGSAGQLPGG